MKNFRKPYLSIIMASVFLFVSCNQESNLFFPEADNISLEKTIEKHIELSNQLSSIYKTEGKTINELDNSPVYYKNKEDFSNFIANSNLKSGNQIILLSEQLSNNIKKYLISNNVNTEKNKNQIIDFLTTEIIKQQNVNKQNYLAKTSSCKSALDAAAVNCEENYAIGLAAVIVSGFISLGWGTVIGIGVVNGLMVKCFNDSSAAYRDCVS